MNDDRLTRLGKAGVLENGDIESRLSQRCIETDSLFGFAQKVTVGKCYLQQCNLYCQKIKLENYKFQFLHGRDVSGHALKSANE